MGIKDFITDKFLERQLKHLPESQRKMIMSVIKKEPELFEKIAKEIKEKKDSGQDEMMASVAVMKKYQSELQTVMSKLK